MVSRITKAPILSELQQLNWNRPSEEFQAAVSNPTDRQDKLPNCRNGTVNTRISFVLFTQLKFYVDSSVSRLFVATSTIIIIAQLCCCSVHHLSLLLNFSVLLSLFIWIRHQCSLIVPIFRCTIEQLPYLVLCAIAMMIMVKLSKAHHRIPMFRTEELLLQFVYF